MSVTVAPMPPASLVELVNEWGTAPREAAGEQDQPYPSIAGQELGIPAGARSRLTDRALTRVADRLHPVFAARTARECATLLSAMLTDTGVRPTVTAADGGADAGWIVDTARDALAGAAVLTLRDHIERYGFSRMGTCTGRACVDVYVDASPTSDRQYCSVTCQNRARAAAFRRRHAHDARR
ncbi:MAG: CGNR zinc finger domain-containing protein [Actinocatenispora sp.]